MEEKSKELLLEDMTTEVRRSARSKRWRRIMDRFVQYRPAVFGIVFLVILILVAVFAPFVAGQDPFYQDYSSLKSPPSAEHWLGTDALGRDVWSRLVYATRVSLSVGLVAVAIYTAIGTTLGAISGYYGGVVDSIIMRLTDIVMTFPALIIIITVPNTPKAIIK